MTEPVPLMEERTLSKYTTVPIANNDDPEPWYVGFTGTQQGMTELQKTKLKSELERLQQQYEPGYGLCLLHGDCIGADAEADEIARELEMGRIAYPGYDEEGQFPKRAYCNVDVIHDAEPYLKRNKAIVRASKLLIAAPKLLAVEQRSGTWSTVRYAEKKGVPTWIVWPDGSVTK